MSDLICASYLETRDICELKGRIRSLNVFVILTISGLSIYPLNVYQSIRLLHHESVISRIPTRDLTSLEYFDRLISIGKQAFQYTSRQFSEYIFNFSMLTTEILHHDYTNTVSLNISSIYQFDIDTVVCVRRNDLGT